MSEYIKTPALSTSFSENGENAKKRFFNILDMSKKQKGIVAFVIIIVLITLSSVLVVCDNGKQGDLPLLDLQPHSLLFADLQPLMGQNTKDFVKKIDVSKARIDKQEYGETYLMRTKINGKKCFVSVEFNNDILIGIRYGFFEGATEAGYDYAKQIRSEISKVYGEPTDNPIILSNTQKRLDDLKNYSEIVHISRGVLTNYSEDWLTQSDSTIERKSPEGYPIRRTQMRIDFTCLPNDSAHVEIRYNLLSPESLSLKEMN